MDDRAPISKVDFTVNYQRIEPSLQARFMSDPYQPQITLLGQGQVLTLWSSTGLDDNRVAEAPLSDFALQVRRRSGYDRLYRLRSTTLSSKHASPRKEFGPRRPKGGDMLVGPALILGRKPRFALLIVTDTPPVSAIDVDLLECGLKVENCIRVIIGEWNLQARKPLPERAWN
jgi:hypothetical protein